VGLGGASWSERASKAADVMSITHNNILYDGQVGENEEAPVRLVSSSEQLYSVGSICNVNLNN
jgi:hypothetical protein